MEGIASSALRIVSDVSLAVDGSAFVRKHPIAVTAACAVAGWFAARGLSRNAARVLPLLAALARAAGGSAGGRNAMRELAVLLRTANRERRER